MPVYGIVLLVILPIIAGVAAFFGGIFFAKKKYEKEIKENPPITEKMIRVMFLQMGRKASESQIKQVMNSMKNAK
ncbi:YneF family protein [Metamycoplasma hyosynoviae]|uniref:Membrane protein n=1 Tax=Metamycoplasma hyosynoviae TaxID=29559 RepID=A0A063Y6Z8_9BACT|nr:YneF family protein [Metamycoplasma hyosynoviae]ASI54136.1 membrane protein [Metamycoplasma hyosynoviae]KDE42087.1 membrane protein [Metamycoplasma hyosynoviae]KDE42213.1 membrane protein [Metamycoplasma hyosynoviae]KDE42520.1 membrane protein [Metamycoplasma hyosynoviae]KDE43900.1 membrane protein [Metamycoplasma hyosynoviae]